MYSSDQNGMTSQTGKSMTVAGLAGFGADKPRIELNCAAGCLPLPANGCQIALFKAINLAVKLASGVAQKLDTVSITSNEARDEKGKNLARLFRFFFGHDPSKPVPWAGNRASGSIVAHRLRAVGRELGGGRRLTFLCDCPGGGANASTNQSKEPNLIRLCAPFWNPPPGLKGLPPTAFRAGIIIHEMLHILYHDFFHHPGHPTGDPERRRDNSHCYEAFVLRAAGYGADQTDVRKCTTRLAADFAGIDGMGQPITFPPENLMEKQLIDEEIKRGTDINKITNRIFWSRHKELNGCRLPATCIQLKKLQQEWVRLHETIRIKAIVGRASINL